MKRTRPRSLDDAAGAVVSHWKENGRAIYPGDQLASDLDQALDEYHRSRLADYAQAEAQAEASAQRGELHVDVHDAAKVDEAAALVIQSTEALDDPGHHRHQGRSRDEQENYESHGGDPLADLARFKKAQTIGAVLADKRARELHPSDARQIIERLKHDHTHALDVARREVWHQAAEMAGGDQTTAGERLALIFEAHAVGTDAELAELTKAAEEGIAGGISTEYAERPVAERIVTDHQTRREL